jgi:phage terminase large subunit-like protein
VLGWAGNVRKTLVERCCGVRLAPTPLRELVHSIVRNNGIKLIVVDVTNGGDHVLNTLAPLPAGVKILPVNLRAPKASRFSTLHDRYQRGQVVHARPITGLEKQLKSYPKVMHDDRIDAVCLGVEYFFGELGGRPIKASGRKLLVSYVAE